MPIYYNLGDALEGERIACQCRKLTGPRVTKGSSAHRGMQLILKKYAYCVIENPLMRIG